MAERFAKLVNILMIIDESQESSRSDVEKRNDEPES